MSPDRRLTHVELLHRPGERDLAKRFFELLGCETIDRDGHWFTSFVDPAAPKDWSTNVLYASEVGEEQWALEQVLAAEPAVQRHREERRRRPQYGAHFGFRVGAPEALDEVVARVAEAGRTGADFAGRVAVDGVYRPGEDGAIAPNMVQAFIWTDVVAAGLLSFGQHIEIQWHLPGGGA